MLIKKISIAFLVMIFIFQSLAYAEVFCNNCFVGNCRCTITDCDSGILDIFSSTSCSMTPDYEFVFSDSYLIWSPESARSYYVKALCSDGKTQSGCNLITARVAEEPATTTTLPKATTTTTLPISEKGGPDYLLIALIVILIVVILFAVYYFFFLKKGKRKTYEELYRKWRRR